MDTVTIGGQMYEIPDSPRDAELFDAARSCGLDPKWRSCVKGYVRPDDTMDDAL